MIDIDTDAYPRPWSYLATFGWAIAASLSSMLIAVIVTILWRKDILSKPVVLLNDGALFLFSTTVWNVLQIVTLTFLARWRRWPPREYLGLVRPKRDAAIALVILALFLSGWDALTYLLGRDIVTPFQVASYASARATGTLPLLWFTFVVAAPAGEEIMFRGFLFRGWVRSKRGVVPGVMIISALWTAMHAQYDWFGLLQIFLMGLLFGWTRWRSESAALTTLMHGMANLWATLETVAKMQWLT